MVECSNCRFHVIAAEAPGMGVMAGRSYGICSLPGNSRPWTHVQARLNNHHLPLRNPFIAFYPAARVARMGKRMLDRCSTIFDASTEFRYWQPQAVNLGICQLPAETASAARPCDRRTAYHQAPGTFAMVESAMRPTSPGT